MLPVNSLLFSQSSGLYFRFFFLLIRWIFFDQAKILLKISSICRWIVNEQNTFFLLYVYTFSNCFSIKILIFHGRGIKSFNWAVFNFNICSFYNYMKTKLDDYNLFFIFYSSVCKPPDIDLMIKMVNVSLMKMYRILIVLHLLTFIVGTTLYKKYSNVRPYCALFSMLQF